LGPVRLAGTGRQRLVGRIPDVANGYVPWLALKAEKLKRIGLLALFVSSAVAIYFAAIWAAGLNLRQLLRR
jgi:putative peptidoglycan lipid II flippase